MLISNKNKKTILRFELFNLDWVVPFQCVNFQVETKHKKYHLHVWINNIDKITTSHIILVKDTLQSLTKLNRQNQTTNSDIHYVLPIM